MSLKSEEYYKAKAEVAKSLAIAASNTRRSQLNENSLLQKSVTMDFEKPEKINRQKELSKIAGVSYDTIYKVKEINLKPLQKSFLSLKAITKVAKMAT